MILIGRFRKVFIGEVIFELDLTKNEFPWRRWLEGHQIKTKTKTKTHEKGFEQENKMSR